MHCLSVYLLLNFDLFNIFLLAFSAISTVSHFDFPLILVICIIKFLLSFVNLFSVFNYLYLTFLKLCNY